MNVLFRLCTYPAEYPWNCTFFLNKHFHSSHSFIIASDFWQTRFPGRSVALDMSMTYIVVAFATVLLNNVFLSLFSFKVRILFGYMISLSTFLFVSICEVAIEVFSVQTAYAANLAAVSLTAIGCTGEIRLWFPFQR